MLCIENEHIVGFWPMLQLGRLSNQAHWGGEVCGPLDQVPVWVLEHPSTQ